jgi:CheY-like chemotaxis protein
LQQAPLILVVDDDPTVRKVVGRYLVRERFTFAEADGGQEGLRLARELNPAAITLDITMPDLDGWTVLTAIKGDPTLADIPVILLTIIDEKNRGFALGASEYLVKPIDRDKLTVAPVTGKCEATGRRRSRTIRQPNAGAKPRNVCRQMAEFLTDRSIGRSTV